MLKSVGIRLARRPANGARLLIASVLAAGGLCDVADAQVAARPDLQPSQVPTREDLAPLNQDSAAPSSKVTIDQRQAIEMGPCPLRDSNVRVNLQTVRFVGSSDEKLAPELATLLASVRPAATGDRPIAAVCDIRDAANAVLHSARYVASVQIPPQEIANGELQLVVVAARITEIVVHGDGDRYRSTLRGRIEQLKALSPLNERDAERILLLADDVPGLDVQLVLRSAGTKPGEVIGDMTITSSPVQVIANVQNAGSHQLGRELGTVRADFFGLTGAADRTFIALSNSAQFKEQHVVQVGHEMGVGSSGFRVGARGSYAVSQPTIPSLSLRSRTIISGLDLSLPLLRQVNSGLTAWGGLEYINQETTVRSGTARVPFTRDRISVAYGRLEGYAGALRADGTSSWSLQGNVEVRQGLNLFSPTPRRRISGGFSPSRFDGNGRATVVRGTLDASWSFAANVWLNASAFGQWSNSALLNLEEFSVGNLTYGRGYDPGANGADRVAAFRIEPRASLTGHGTATRPKNFQLEVSGFYDNVRIWNQDSNTIETKRTLASLGGGVRAIWAGRMIADLTYAKPLRNALQTDSSRPPARLLFSLTTKLLPWRTR
jgi:hemolysin activation/secretion protein